MSEQSIKTLEQTLPIPLDDIASDVSLGGQVTARDVSVPYLYVVQQNSPQATPDSPKYIQGCISGNLLLTVLNETYEGRQNGINFIPCYYESVINQWKPKTQGGGIVHVYPVGHEIMKQGKPDEKGKGWFLPNGDALVETAYHYMLVRRKNGILTQAICPMKSTHLRASKSLNSFVQVAMIPGTNPPKQAPRFLYWYTMFTEKEIKGEYIYQVPVIKETGMLVSPEEYQAAKSFASIAATGVLRRAIEEDMDDVAPAGSTVI